MAVVLVTGASGMLGKTLVPILRKQGHLVKTLTTKVFNKDVTQNAFLWNIKDDFIEQEALDGIEVIIHLAGSTIGLQRWTAQNRKTIIDSRVRSASLLLSELQRRGQRIKQFISASGIGFYTDPCKELLDETHGPGNGFPAEICLQWEAAAAAFESAGATVSVARFGPVMSADGGLLQVIKRTLPIRVLPVLGSPKNTLSWIHIEDAAGMLSFIMNKNLGGTFNAVAPKPASQKEFLRAIAGDRFCVYPIVPAFVLRLFLGERAALPLTDQVVSCKKIEAQGFQFQFPEIRSAIANLLHGKK